MKNFKSSFTYGVLLGILLCLGIAFILDLIVYIIFRIGSIKILDADAVFIIGILCPVILAKIMHRKEGKYEVVKGLMLSAVIWGAAFVFLFQFLTIKSVFFRL